MAAGGSRRLGSPKQLLSIAGEILINRMIRTIKGGGIKDLYVVLGCFSDQIENSISDQKIHILKNDDWEEGISSSIRTGINNIEKNPDSVMFFIVDQPFLRSELVNQFIFNYESYNPEILVTRVKGQFCHPVLFSSKFFEELSVLKGDQGGKQIYMRQGVSYFDWDDDRLLIDIDTPEDVGQLNLPED